LYGLFSGDELVYVDKIEDTAQAYSDAINLHRVILENGGKHQNYMYEYMLDRREEGHSIGMGMLHELPGADVEVARVALVYALRPIGNWYEWNWLEEKEERERLGLE
jgi:hypothetical protein